MLKATNSISQAFLNKMLTHPSFVLKTRLI
jgi:hypothetical protein